jgi:hypothetical protein
MGKKSLLEITENSPHCLAQSRRVKTAKPTEISEAHGPSARSARNNVLMFSSFPAPWRENQYAWPKGFLSKHIMPLHFFMVTIH